MKRHTPITLLLTCSLFVGLASLEFAPLVSQAVAQRGGEDGDRTGGGERRGGWRRFRREGGGRENGDDRGGERDRSRENDDSDDDDDGDRRRRRDRQDRDGGGESSFDVADYARTLLRERDKNGNKVLDGKEISELRGRAAGADLNNDKVITADELIARLSDRRPASDSSGQTTAKTEPSSESSAKSTTSATGKPTRVYAGTAGGAASKDAKDAAAKRRSYRFTPPGERLTTGLPSWFKTRDRNRDGQVAMSEYSRLWNRRMVGEFREYDVNDDGVITPKEAAE